jgi:predicted dehydrogenase
MNAIVSAHRPGLPRRAFLRHSTAALAALSLTPRRVFGGAGATTPGGKLRLGFIGVGGRGSENLRELARLGDVAPAAFCDVDANHLANVTKQFPGVPTYRDFRALLDKEPDLDAVVVSTPDHIHAVAVMAALRRGKHVYCEKPLTRTVQEARAVARAAREAKVATQMGNQGMAFEGNRLLNEWLWDGAIGAVREVHAWSDRPTHRGKLPLWWPQGVERPEDTRPAPAHLDWELWLGPAPHRPYHPAWGPFQWRGWWDFGSGGLGDMGIHNLAPVFSALKLQAPVSVHASSTPVYPDSVPLACTVHYEFAARGDLPPVQLHWYDGGLLPARPNGLPDDLDLDPEDGVLFVGEKGQLLSTGWGTQRLRLLPEKLHRDYARPPKTLPRSAGHHREWVDACKGAPAPRSSFDFAGPLTEAVLLGSLCVRRGGEKLHWDSANLRITNAPEANQLLHYRYRDGWTL